MNLETPSGRALAFTKRISRPGKRLDEPAQLSPRPGRFRDPILSDRAFALFWIALALLAVALLFAPGAHGAPFTWNGGTGAKAWNSNANWTPNTGFPNAIGDIANVTQAINAAATISLNQPITVGILNLGDTNRTDSYTIQSGTGGAASTLTLNNNGSASQITFVAGSGGDTISAPIVIGGTAGLTITGSTTTQARTNVISGGITSTGTNSNLTITNNQAVTGQMQFTTASINNSGTLLLNGTSATATTLISGGIGSNVTNVSNTSANIVTIQTGAVGNSGTLSNTGSGNFTISSNINSTVTNITLGGTGTATQLLSGASINNTGTITNNGSTSAATTISGNIGSNVTGVTQNSGTSALILTGTNNYGTTLISSGTLQVGNGATTGTLGTGAVTNNGTLAFNRSNNFTVANAIGGSGAVTKSGAGIATLTATDTYAGATTINTNGGTLEIANNGGATTGQLANTSGITVNTGGTLLLSGSASVTDRINDSATMTLSGGTFNTGGLTERTGTSAGIGALTLTANSTIDFGSGNSILQFAGLGAHTPTSGPNLLITNWSGSFNSGGTDQLLFAGVKTDFTSKFSQADVIFNGGTAGYNIYQFGGFYEVTAVPEPGTWVGATLVALAIGYTQRKRFFRGVKSAAK